MLKQNQKIKLSDNLKLGIAEPSSQGAFFKVGGAFFLIISLILAVNIYHNIKNLPAASNSANAGVNPQVLGAFDQSQNAAAGTDTAPKTTTYTVQKGDTLFNIAQSLNTNWVLIASANNLKAPYQLKPGAVLQVPQAK